MANTILTVRPANKLLSASDWTVVGAATYDAAMSDNSNSSYAQNIASAGFLKQAFADFTIPTLSQVRTVTPRYRFRFAAGGPGYDDVQANMSVIDVFGVEDFEPSYEYMSQNLGGSFVTVAGFTRSVDPLGNPWTLLTLQSLRVQFRANTVVAYSQCQMAELYLDVGHNQAPTVALTAPTGTITTTTRPIVSWTYSDPESDAQERYRIRIYTAAQITAGQLTVTNKALTSNIATLTTSTPHRLSVGMTTTVAGVDSTFNGTWLVTAVPSPTTFSYAVTHANVASTASSGTVFSPDLGFAYLWDSGEVFSAVTSVTPGADQNGNYTVYVQTADVGSGGRYGPWGTISYTVTVAPPGTPTISASYDATHQRNVVAVVGTTLSSAQAAAVATQTFTVESSDDGGTTWKQIRGSGYSLYGTPNAYQAASTPGTETGGLYDTEMHPGLARIYRARASVIVATLTITGSNSASTSPLTYTAAGWNLRDPITPANSMFAVRLKFTAETQHENVAVFRPLGRLKPVIVADTIGGWDGSLDVVALTASEVTAAEKLVALQTPLLLQSALGEHRYIRAAADRTRVRLGAYKRRESIPFVECDPP